jgi:hypothetical protein
MIPQNLPTYLACVAGLIAVPFFWNSMRRRAVLVLIALLAKVLASVASMAVMHWMFTQIDAGSDPRTIGLTSGSINSGVAWLHAAAWALLIVAAFSGSDAIQAPARGELREDA